MEAQPFEPPRRIVTGHDEHGNAVVAIDYKLGLSGCEGGFEGEARLVKAGIYWSTNIFPAITQPRSRLKTLTNICVPRQREEIF